MQMRISKTKITVLFTAFAALIITILSTSCFADAKDEQLATKPKGQVLYVSVNGSDANPGTEIRPWRTIQKAADNVKPAITYISEKEHIKNASS
jgi:hypothetical protein